MVRRKTGLGRASNPWIVRSALLFARVCVAVGSLSAACNNPGASSFSEHAENRSYGRGKPPWAGSKQQPPWAIGNATWDADQSGGAGGGPPISPSDAGTTMLLLGPPYGSSTECGDAIVGLDSNGYREECDDGGDDAPDACTAGCQTRDQPIVAGPATDWTSRVLGAGRHPIAGLSEGFITTFVDTMEGDPRVGARLFNIWGQPTYEVVVSEGVRPIFEANPVAAALPTGGYAVAWSSFDEDGEDLGVVLRRIAADGTLGPLKVANQGKQFSQLDPDIVWTGNEIVAAWVDFANAVSAPDLRYQRFDQNLLALGDEQVLAGGSGPESAVALAPFNGGWAAAYREGLADGTENVVVKVGEQTFRVGPVLGGPIEDRPALVELDETHLLLVFSAAANTDGTVPRIRYSVIDVESQSAPTFQALDPLDDVFTLETQVTHLSPAAAKGSDGFYVAWRSEARPGDAAGDQLWLKYLTWALAASPALEVREQEMLIPRTCESNFGDQRTPALARVELPPHGALAIAWDDYAHTQGTGEPDVIVHYAPTHERLVAYGSAFKEKFFGANGSAWSSHWSRESTGSGTITHSVQASRGEIRSTSGGGAAVMRVNHHTALNVELVTDVRFSGASVRSALIARRDDTDPTSYLAAEFGTVGGGNFRLYAVDEGNSIDIATTPLPSSISVWGPLTDFRIRFRAVTEADGDLVLSAKFWEVDLGEPAGWLLETTLPLNVTGPLADVVNRLRTRPGRFGLIGNPPVTGRYVTFDNFRATFFEGDYAGDLEEAAPSLPLLRELASYRICNGAFPFCSAGEGCCVSDQECAPGLRCGAGVIDLHGVGSHAKTCTPDHCHNLKKDADEFRADCGGADCAPCDPCFKGGTSGNSGYCSPTCPCGIGEGDCVASTQCLDGLLCAQRGFNYGNVATADDVCIPHHCRNRILDLDFDEGPNPDCGGDCGSCEAPPGYCTVYDPCGPGGADCDYSDECAAGLVCGSSAGWGTTTGNTCNGAHCNNNVLDGNETTVDCGGDCGPICL